MSKEQWYEEVIKLAKSYGYSVQQISMFSMDIAESYENGDTPGQCVSKVF